MSNSNVIIQYKPLNDRRVLANSSCRIQLIAYHGLQANSPLRVLKVNLFIPSFRYNLRFFRSSRPNVIR